MMSIILSASSKYWAMNQKKMTFDVVLYKPVKRKDLTYKVCWLLIQLIFPFFSAIAYRLIS